MNELWRCFEGITNPENKSQKDWADLLNVSQKTISNYEKDQREPDFKTINVLADYFFVSVDYLLGRSEIKSPDINQDPEIIAFSKARQKMTPEQYQKWKQVSKVIFPEAFPDEDNK